MKHFAVILLLTGLLGQTFSRFFIVADYQLNKDYIANFLCENKNKPQLHCKGKCQMMKKLQQEEKKDQQNPGRKGDNKSEVISFQKNDVQLSPFLSYSLLIYPRYRETNTSQYLSAPFHPPRV